MLSKEHRLRLEKDIKALFAKGRSVFGIYTGIRYRPNKLALSRFAIVIGTKVSKRAVVRNRLRRQFRSIIYKHLVEIKPGFDVVLMVKKEAIGKKSKELETEFIQTLKRKSPLFK